MSYLRKNGVSGFEVASGFFGVSKRRNAMRMVKLRVEIFV